MEFSSLQYHAKRNRNILNDRGDLFFCFVYMLYTYRGIVDKKKHIHFGILNDNA